MINILLVDDHPSVREGTKIMIEASGEYKVALASTGEEAIELIQKNNYDLYIFDLYMPDYNGLELTRKLLNKQEESVILIMTGFDIAPHFNVLVEAGATGFISKTASKDQLLQVIKCALRKEAVLPVSLLKQLRRSEVSATLNEGEQQSTVSLNEKELQVLHEASNGMTNKEIAKKLLMSQRMVEYHLTKIFACLKVSSRGEAVAKARELRLLPSEKFF